jgi:hypothetical protein
MASAPQPSLLWSFNGSNVESIRTITPALSLSTAYTNGKYGQAIYFNGTQGVTPPTSNVFYNISPTIPIGTNGCTLTSWVNIGVLLTSAGQCFFVYPKNNQGNGIRLSYQWSGGGNLHFLLCQFYFNGSTSTLNSYSPVVAGTWYHTTCVISNTGLTSFYVNGALIGTPATATLAGSDAIDGVTVGSGPGFNQFNGSVSDVRIYNTALSAQQVLGIYQSRGIPPSLTMTTGRLPGPTLAWQFEGNTNDTITGLTAASSPNISYSAGVYGQAVVLNNSPGVAPTSYVITNQAAQTFSNIISGFSFSFWINWSVITLATQYVMGIFSGPANININELVRFVWRGASAPPTFNMFSGAAGGVNSTSFNFTPTTGVWYNFMGTVNNTTWAIYLNGVFQVSSVASGTTTGITSFNPSVHVGVSLYGGGVAGLNGLVDDVRLYNTVLSAQQVLGIYQSRGIPPSLTMTQTSRSGTSTTMNSG